MRVLINSTQPYLQNKTGFGQKYFETKKVANGGRSRSDHFPIGNLLKIHDYHGFSVNYHQEMVTFAYHVQPFVTFSCRNIFVSDLFYFEDMDEQS